MIKKANPEDVTSYFANDTHISQSGLKMLLKGVNQYLSRSINETKLYYEEKGHFVIGSGVDTRLTYGEEGFLREYHVAIAPKPADKGLSIITHLFDTAIENLGKLDINSLRMTDITDEKIIESCEMHEFQGRWGNPAKIKAVMKMDGYFNELCISYGKQIISIEELNKIRAISDSILNSEFAYLFDDTFVDSKEIDIFYQVPIYGMTNGIQTKVLLDILFINHTTKTIYPIDLKTIGSPVMYFDGAVNRFRYDFQGAFYKEHVKDLVKNTPKLAGYDVENFQFIVESSENINGPALFQLDDDMEHRGKFGIDPIYGASYKNHNQKDFVKLELLKYEKFGYSQALDLYKWHLENGFAKDRVLAENNNKLLITPIGLKKLPDGNE